MYKNQTTVNGVKWSPTVNQLTSCADDKLCKIWDVESGTMIWSMHHTDKCNHIDYSPCGTLIACCHNQGIRIWESGSVTRIVFDFLRISTAVEYIFQDLENEIIL